MKYYFIVILLLACHLGIGQNRFFRERKIILKPLNLNTQSGEMGPSLVYDTLYYSYLKPQEESVSIETPEGYTELKEKRIKDQELAETYYEIFKVPLNKKGNPISEAVYDKGKSSNYHDGPLCYNHETGEYYISRSNEKKAGNKRFKKKKIYEIKIEIYREGRGGPAFRKNFPYTNKRYSMTHPSLSASGDTLYFSSDMPGGLGGFDIYYCVRRNGNWSEPANAGSRVNTADSEVFPYIGSNGTLYFSSERESGLGGLDIYYSERDRNGYLTDARILKAPINTEFDDFSMILSEKGDYGFITSNRPKIMGWEEESNDDIYKIDFEEKEKQNLVLVQEKAPSLPQRLDLDTLDRIGDFYGSKKFIVNNIYYEFDKWDLTEEAKRNLDFLVSYLKEHRDVSIKINSHTDSRGSDSYNMKLSRKRSSSVEKYLTRNGIRSRRMDAYGFGETQLVNECADGVDCPEEMHQENRRTEIEFIKEEDEDTPPPIEHILEKAKQRDQTINYYLIVGSFTDFGNAKNFLQQLEEQGYEPQYFQDAEGNTIYVSVDGCEDLDSAKLKHAELKPKFSGIWIYKVK